ncbi:SH3 domain-containing protein [Chamaesiphon polymorphus CCALA 037]|uniref:SH3 domain-containing protein n=2 Tax=Chamaesiphon TaxID=217161 RepID=A0A2T1GFS9_9CYAN|nr:SH3 domain-containing protein [Chamaesiphon polymorphus CCALA 037]
MMKILTATALLLATTLPAAAERVGPAYRSAQGNSYGNVCTSERGSSLSLRTGPGKNYRALTQIRDGNSVVLFNSTYGRDGFKWWQTAANGRQGWVRADYVCGV